MSIEQLSSRATIGMYYEALQASTGASWIGAISNYFTSDQASETYAWLGMPPALREWIGGRHAKEQREDSHIITNKHYEATLEILLSDLRRDKSGQVEARIAEFAQRGLTHFASLLSTDIINGESTVCYDGQYFFDTDHSEGDSGTLSNDITTDISALPTSVHGSAAAAPSPEEMQQAIQKSITQMMTFVDDQGEPLNEMANEFLVMVPAGLANVTRSAMSQVRAAGPATFDMDGYKIAVAVNPRLTTGGWTDKFVTFRADGSIKPLIRQEETEPQLKLKGEDSEFAFDNDAIQIGIDTWRGTGYGRWQGAVLNQLV